MTLYSAAAAADQLSSRAGDTPGDPDEPATGHGTCQMGRVTCTVSLLALPTAAGFGFY